MVLCAASSYEKKYFLDPAFLGLPETVQKELQSACVLFSTEVGGIVVFEFDEDGQLLIRTSAADSDIYYDEIEAGLAVRKLMKEKEDLFCSLELYYRVLIEGDVEELFES